MKKAGHRVRLKPTTSESLCTADGYPPAPQCIEAWAKLGKFLLVATE